MNIVTALLVVLLVVLVAFYLYMTRNNNYWKNRGIPYLRPVPFFGNTFEIYRLRSSLQSLLEKVHNTFTGPYCGFFIHDRPALLLKDLDIMKSVLVKDFTYFYDHTMARNVKHDPIGAFMLILLKNPEWKTLRKKVTPAFTSGRMRKIFELMQQSGDQFIQYIDRLTNETPVLETREMSSRYATHLITSVAFGMESNCYNDEKDPFRTVSRRIFNFDDLIRGFQTTLFFISPLLVKILGLRFIDGFSGKFLADVFWRTVRHKETNGLSRNDVVDVLLEVRNKEKEDDPVKLEGNVLVGQAAQFFIAGFETVASTITFTLYELAMHPHIQNKLREEVMHFKTERESITYETLKEMTYLECCIKETLRKYPVLPFLDRRCSSDYKVPGHDLVIEKDVLVYISISALHKDPKYYSDPEEYIPDRFNEENIQNIPPFAYLPFGEGPRNCIGSRFAMVSLKSILFKIIGNYRVEAAEETQKIVFNPNGFLLAPLHGVKLKFRRIASE